MAEQVTVTHEDGEKMVFEYDFGSNAQEAIERFGDEAVFHFFLAGAKAALRNRIYSLSHSETGDAMSPEKIREAMADWKPAKPERTTGPKDPMSSFKKAFAAMSPEERKAAIAEIRQSAEV